MDDRIKEELWAAFHESLLKPMRPLMGHWWFRGSNTGKFVLAARRRLGLRVDDISDAWEYICGDFRREMFRREWWGVYDFLEIALETAQDNWWQDRKRLRDAINLSLDQVGRHYCAVDTRIVQRFAQHEITTLDQALSNSSSASSTHLHRALSLLSQRPAGDFRNSLKESLCAVEAAARDFAEDERANLGELCSRLKGQKLLHSNLATSLSHLYWYGSGFGGARHALNSERVDSGDDIDGDDARLFLICCSAWVNYFSSRRRVSQGKDV